LGAAGAAAVRVPGGRRRGRRAFARAGRAAPGRRAVARRPADVAEPDIPARRLDLGVAADLVQIEVAGCRFRVERPKPTAAAEVGRSSLGAESRALRRSNAEADVELAQEAEPERAPSLHVDDDLVAAAGLAQLDPRVVEKLAHLIGAAAGVELDVGGRAG